MKLILDQAEWKKMIHLADFQLWGKGFIDLVILLLRDNPLAGLS